MPSTVSFTINTELYKSGKQINVNKTHIKKLEQSIKNYSRCNSAGEIIYTKMGIINITN